MNDNAQQSTCPVRGLTLAGQALVNKLIAFEDFAKKPYCVPLAVLFTFQTGLRISEVVALKWQDINFVDKTIRIARFERVQQEYTDDFEVLTKCQHIIIDSDTKGEFGERIVDLTDDAENKRLINKGLNIHTA